MPKFGREFEEFWGKTWADCSNEALLFYRRAVQKSLGDESKKQYHALDKKRCEAIDHVVHQRAQDVKEGADG